MPKATEITAEGLFAKSIPEPNTGCWLWLGWVNNEGRAMTSRGPVARRLLGVDKLHALHHCDQPCCVNPDHLYAGTHADNMRDKRQRRRGKGTPGNRHNTRLTEAQARLIQASKEPLKVLAERYGVSLATISICRNRKTWGG